jgi:AraC-like DNA-binding protein
MNHQVACRGRVQLQVLYVDPELDTQPQLCRVFETSSLVRALIEEIITFEHAYDEAGREGQLVRLLLDEIARMPNIDIHAPMPEDKRLLRVCNAILANPADPRDIDDWADVAGMGRRTFTRAFKDNTGMGLATWRQQVRLMEALSLLHAGWSVTTVAYEVGYESPSAFTAMFHRTFGMTPTQMIES